MYTSVSCDVLGYYILRFPFLEILRTSVNCHHFIVHCYKNIHSHLATELTSRRMHLSPTPHPSPSVHPLRRPDLGPLACPRSFDRPSAGQESADAARWPRGRADGGLCDAAVTRLLQRRRRRRGGERGGVPGRGHPTVSRPELAAARRRPAPLRMGWDAAGRRFSASDSEPPVTGQRLG